MRKKLVLLLAIAALGVGLAVASRMFVGGYVDDKATLAQTQAKYLAAVIAQFRSDTGRLPSSLEELVHPNAVPGGPYAQPDILIDPWGRAFLYRPGVGDTDFALLTLGADGKVGGTGQNEDFEVSTSAHGG